MRRIHYIYIYIQVHTVINYNNNLSFNSVFSSLPFDIEQDNKIVSKMCT